MTGSHRHFEYLCLLAAGQALSEPEEAALRRHAQDCMPCRDRLRELAQLESHLLLLHAGKHRAGRLPQGMRERFIARAIAEGVPLTSSSPTSFGKLGLASMLLTALLLLAAVVNAGLPTTPVVDTTPLENASTQAAERPTSSARYGLLRRSEHQAGCDCLRACPALAPEGCDVDPKPPFSANPLAAPLETAASPIHLLRGKMQSHAAPRTTWRPLYPRIFPARDFSVRIAPGHSFLLTMPPALDRWNGSLDTSLRSRFEAGRFTSQSPFVFATTTVSALRPSPDLAVATPPRTFQFSADPKSYFVQGKAWETR